MNPNLIYNGDFHKGTDSWSGTGITTCSEGGVTLTGNLNQSGMYIPVSSNRRYKLTYDIKFNTPDGKNNFYIALYPYDSNREFINMTTVQKRAGSITTLTKAINAGDTTAEVASIANWTTGYIGIYDIKAYDERRASKILEYSSKNENILTLSSAYSGATIPAGTKVANNFGGSTYFYPHTISKNNMPSEWTTYSVEFNGGNSMRQTCMYFIFHTLGYSHNYSIRNINIECISDFQECPYKDIDFIPNLTKQGCFKSYSFDEVGMKIRYIRDNAQGNTVNTKNHWNEIQVFNDVGENVAINHKVSIGTEIYSNSVITDGIPDSQWVNAQKGTPLILDLGYVENVYKIIIWHYYPDGRTYTDNVTEVSVDGENWIQVYNGTKPETSNGNTIELHPNMMSIYDDGIIKCKEIIEW